MECQETEIASFGQTSTHAPQSPHVSASTTATFSLTAIASSGHAETHSLQAEHFSASIDAAIY
jgi:hypothetical protein